MAIRRTMNVSLPAALVQFVQAQVDGGRYRTASEVIRDSLRLLEQAEHRRLLEKWLYSDLSEEELRGLPDDLKVRVRERVDEWIDEGRRSGDAAGWLDGDAALDEVAQRLRAAREAEVHEP